MQNGAPTIADIQDSADIATSPAPFAASVERSVASDGNVRNDPPDFMDFARGVLNSEAGRTLSDPAFATGIGEAMKNIDFGTGSSNALLQSIMQSFAPLLNQLGSAAARGAGNVDSDGRQGGDGLATDPRNDNDGDRRDCHRRDGETPRTKNLCFTLPVTLTDLYKGKTKKLKVKRKRTYQQSDGSYKMVEEKKSFSIKIEPGMNVDEPIVFGEEADQIPGYHTGDIVINLEEQPHDVFMRHNSDLIMSLDLSIGEIYFLDATVDLPDGRRIRVGNASGDVLTEGNAVRKIRGCGMPVHSRPGTYGDLFVQFNVVPPTEPVSDRELLFKLFHALNSSDGVDIETSALRSFDRLDSEDLRKLRDFDAEGGESDSEFSGSDGSEYTDDRSRSGSSSSDEGFERGERKSRERTRRDGRRVDEGYDDRHVTEEEEEGDDCESDEEEDDEDRSEEDYRTKRGHTDAEPKEEGTRKKQRANGNGRSEESECDADEDAYEYESETGSDGNR